MKKTMLALSLALIPAVAQAQASSSSTAKVEAKAHVHAEARAHGVPATGTKEVRAIAETGTNAATRTTPEKPVPSAADAPGKDDAPPAGGDKPGEGDKTGRKAGGGAHGSTSAAVTIDANLAIARKRGLPEGVLRRLVAEGRAKGATDAQIASASTRALVQLQASFDAIVRGGHARPSEEETARGATLLARGYTVAQLESVARRTPAERSLVVTLESLARVGGMGSVGSVVQGAHGVAGGAVGATLGATAGTSAGTGAMGAATGVLGAGAAGVAGAGSGGTTGAIGVAGAGGLTGGLGGVTGAVGAGAAAGATGAIGGALGGRRP